MYPVWPLIAVYALMTTGDFHSLPKMLNKRCWSRAQIGTWSSKCTSGLICIVKPTKQNTFHHGIKSSCKKKHIYKNHPLKIHVVLQMVLAVASLAVILMYAEPHFWPRLECIFVTWTETLFHGLLCWPKIENYAVEEIRCEVDCQLRLALLIWKIKKNEQLTNVTA